MHILAAKIPQIPPPTMTISVCISDAGPRLRTETLADAILFSCNFASSRGRKSKIIKYLLECYVRGENRGVSSWFTSCPPTSASSCTLVVALESTYSNKTSAARLSSPPMGILERTAPFCCFTICVLCLCDPRHEQSLCRCSRDLSPAIQ